MKKACVLTLEILLCSLAVAILSENYDCDPEKITEELEEAYEKILQGPNTFFSRVSCFVCSEHICNFVIDKHCNIYDSCTVRIPVFNNLVEFALLSDIIFYAQPIVYLYFNDYYYLVLKSSITTYAERKFKVVLQEVSENDPVLKNDKKVWEFIHDDNTTTVYSFTIKVFENATVFVNWADKFIDLSTSRYFSNSFVFKVARPELLLGNFRIRYCFNHDFTLDTTVKTKMFNGFPVMVPCSPGGYIVDPETGKFAKITSDYNVATMRYNLDSVIPFFYEDKALVYAKSNETYESKKRIPIYIHKCGQPKPFSQMVASTLAELEKPDNCTGMCPDI